MLKQTFGLDFKSPNFWDEEKFRRKIENCLNFFVNYQPPREVSDEHNFEFEIGRTSREISNKIRSLNFSGAYQDFKSLTYNKVSSDTIPFIKNRGISQESLSKIISEFSKVSKVFVPITAEEKLSQNSNYSIFR